MEERIPARITEWICNQTGTPCGSENKSTCHQLTGLLDVGYTVKIQEEEMVVYRRNLTVGIGCACKPMMTLQRLQQPERIYHL